MRVIKIKKDYTRETAPKEIKTAIDNAAIHLSACWMLMSLVMVHLDEAENYLTRYGANKHEVKQAIQAINHNFNKLNDWYRKLAGHNGGQGQALFNKEYIEFTTKINRLMQFTDDGKIEEED